MRIYVPATLTFLRDALAQGEFRPEGGTAFAVTSALEHEYAGADVEELEYLAMHDAALASLRMIARSGAPAVRVVLAVEVAGDGAPTVTGRSDLDRAAVEVDGAIRWRSVAAIHMDGGEVAETVAAAAEAIVDADLGDADAEIIVGNAEDVDLAWYAPSEIAYLLPELGLGL